MYSHARVFHRQLIHMCLLGLLIAGLWGISHLPAFQVGEALGLDTRTWAALCVFNAVVHQVYVWFCWRWELHGRLLSRALGPGAFTIYAVGFSVMILARPILHGGLAMANAGTLAVDEGLAQGLAVVLCIPVVYLIYSIHRYFGFQRAFGIDHFDSSFGQLPMVKQGIFRFSGNAMYTFGFLIFWALALWFRSFAALALALFAHLYIWIHYFVTEKPDMETIYGPGRPLDSQ